jgi:hypothetical protein
VAQQELSSILVIKYVCPEIDEEAEDPCIGREEEAEGTAIEFVLIGPDDSGEEFWFDVVIEEFEGDSVGATEVTEVPLGAYEVCEAVPDGYEAFGVPLSDTQEAYDNCVAFEVGANQEDVLFVNVPEDVEELPDTGAGLAVVPAPGAWVPVLIASALLLVLAGSRLRPRTPIPDRHGQPPGEPVHRHRRGHRGGQERHLEGRAGNAAGNGRSGVGWSSPAGRPIER